MFSGFSFREEFLKKLGPTRAIAFGFLITIITGALLLCLPIANQLPSAGFLNNLFVATSATCVTGLVPIVIAHQYTLFGYLVILALIQIGGLGLMTLVAIFLVFMRQKLRYSEKKMMQEALNTRSLKDMPLFLKKILKYTFVFELTGMIFLSFRFVPQFGWAQGLFYSVFHSISAFCNAGLDILGGNSLINYATDPLISLTICGLIIMGGLGFAVWFDYSTQVKRWAKEKLSFRKMIKGLNLHTKMVTIITILLLAGGTVFIMAMEFNNPATMGNMNFFEKLLCSFFQSTTLRTAGFATVSCASLNMATQFIMVILMFIGGSSGGTAGGIKTTTFGLMVLMIVNEIRGQENVTLLKRSISKQTTQKAFIITAMFMITLFGALIILSITENTSFMAILFEAVSAIATVGLSMDLTASLSAIGKIVIILLMYAGRIGPIALFLSVVKRRSGAKGDIVYPTGEIMVG